MLFLQEIMMYGLARTLSARSLVFPEPIEHYISHYMHAPLSAAKFEAFYRYYHQNSFQPLQCSQFLLRQLFCCCGFFNSIISVFCLQPPVQPIHSSATATCVLTTPWCVMGFRTVSTHGMKTTARVNAFLSHLTAYCHCPWILFFSRLDLYFSTYISGWFVFLILCPSSFTCFPLQRSDPRDFFIRSQRPMVLSLGSHQA